MPFYQWQKLIERCFGHLKCLSKGKVTLTEKFKFGLYFKPLQRRENNTKRIILFLATPPGPLYFFYDIAGLIKSPKYFYAHIGFYSNSLFRVLCA